MPQTIDWQKAETLLLWDPVAKKVVYECDGVIRGRLMYFLASFNYKKPTILIALDQEGYILGSEKHPPVRGKFGPGVIVRNNI